VVAPHAVNTSVASRLVANDLEIIRYLRIIIIYRFHNGLSYNESCIIVFYRRAELSIGLALAFFSRRIALYRD
jgi:hypothetical protein